MGAPAFEYRKIFKENNVSVFSSNYVLYGDMSNRVTTILRKYSPDNGVILTTYKNFDQVYLFNGGVE